MVNIDPMPEAPKEELYLTPEAGDDYVNTQAMLPRGDSMARGKKLRESGMQRATLLVVPIQTQYFTLAGMRLSLTMEMCQS